MDTIALKPRRKTALAPAQQPAPRPDLELTDESGYRKVGPSWSEVESAIRNLDPGNYCSFCCLADRDNNWIQVLRGFVGYHVEKRLTTLVDPSSATMTLMRACDIGGSTKPLWMAKDDSGNTGEERDILSVDQVVQAFRGFWKSPNDAGGTGWRLIEV